MAVWKKIIVSGSNAHLLSVTASAFSASATAGAVGFIGTASWAVTASHALNVSAPSLVASASAVAIHNSASAAGTYYPVFVNATSGYPSQSVDSTGLQYIPSTDTLIVGNIGATGSLFNIATSTATTINIGSSTANVVIPGNLSVQGTTTTVSSSNLLIADKFILLASGSTGNTEGGIIVQSLAGGTGFGYFLDTVTAPRWGFTSSLVSTDNTTNYTADEYAVSARSGSADPVNPPTYGGAGLGHGNIYVNGAGDIWIYA